jgi:hypothetical protein
LVARLNGSISEDNVVAKIRDYSLSAPTNLNAIPFPVRRGATCERHCVGDAHGRFKRIHAGVPDGSCYCHPPEKYDFYRRVV